MADNMASNEDQIKSCVCVFLWLIFVQAAPIMSMCFVVKGKNKKKVMDKI